MHNLLLNVMINTGVLGGLLLAACWPRRPSRSSSRPSAFPDMMIVMVLVFGIADIPLFSVVPDAHAAVDRRRGIGARWSMQGAAAQEASA